MCFFKNLFLYSEPQIRHTEHIVMKNKEWSTKIVNIMTNGAGILVLGCGNISHFVKMLNFNKIFNSPPGHKAN